ncbi:cytochrome-c peroxidase [Thalassotalea sp. M1531]|uniref:Cytochrome-c peroxidase n=1 Tax=Thalassotalea algicola TaxID=2716224 RepID=A0A7Y0LAA9_9GAMM|nr:cytochrome c peroxidase [Thalassotalea algicola]NMP30855.1 cytochrome-c peroxidase [Thalassotalea algicola]
MRTLLFFFAIIGCLLSINTIAASNERFQLASKCPPSFELTNAGVCRLVNRYQFYDSVQGRGVGGTQTSLPEHRDGFSPAQIDLGRYLFFDPALSKDGSVSCASCHQPDKGFSDDLDRSIGITGEKVARSAPTLWNVAFLDKFFWDARANTLEQQAAGPLFDPMEMGNSPEQLLSTLADNKHYPRMFAQAFPDSSEIKLEDIYLALTAFQTSLISLNSRYDQYAHGYHEALTEKEQQGHNIFRSFVARCSECHQPPLFTNNQVAVIGVAEAEGVPFDIGAEKTFEAKKLRGGFKVPTLRNIVKTAPYMHAGNFTKLRDSVEFYNKGRGHAVPKNEKLQLHWHIWEPELTEEELDLIVEFLGALTDESLTPAIPKTVPSGLAPIDEKYQASQQKNNNNNQNQTSE